jgi:RNA polymerase sigma factor (sigma-70 family)
LIASSSLGLFPTLITFGRDFRTEHSSRNRRAVRLPGVRHRPFDQIVTEHGPTVLRVCRAVLSHADADDAWSETFLAALRAYPELPPDTNMQAWLVRVAHRKAIDQHRARARRPTPTLELPERPGPEPPDAHPELWEALAALPDKQRFAVAYHHLAGLPYAEVAELLGNSEAAARRAAADGVKALRGRIAPAGSDPGGTTGPHTHPADTSPTGAARTATNPTDDTEVVR